MSNKRNSAPFKESKYEDQDYMEYLRQLRVSNWHEAFMVLVRGIGGR